jgi:hypothetical protein
MLSKVRRTSRLLKKLRRWQLRVIKMRAVVELNRGEYAQVAFSSILERIADSRKTFFSSLLEIVILGAWEMSGCRRIRLRFAISSAPLAL